MKLLTLLAGIVAIALVILAGPLYKFEILGLGNAFFAMRIGFFIGVGAIILAIIQVIFLRKNIAWSATGLSVVLAVIAIALPLSLMMKAKSVPAIHDISTDLVNPPPFVAILPLRANAPNPAEYQGEEIANQQRSAYPVLKTQMFNQPKAEVFNAALKALEEMGLEVVSSELAEGRIEAFDTTTWFGFIDDVVIRIESSGQTTTLDARSKSRIGKSDVGKNAERLNELIAKTKSNVN